MNLRLAGHETFYPRQQWLQKGIAFLPELYGNTDHPTDQLGVGINMVRSIRHWIKAFELVENGQRTPLAEDLLARDPTLSAPATAWILHHTLASSETHATAWHWFFCHSGLQSFTKAQFVSGLDRFIAGQTNQKYAARSLERDFDVLVRMYAERPDEEGARDSVFYPSVFADLGLIRHNRFHNRYLRVQDPPVPPAVFHYCLLDFTRRRFPDAAVIDLDLVRTLPGAPFLTFGVGMTAYIELHARLSPALHRKIALSHTAGMHTIAFGRTKKNELLDAAYRDSTASCLL